jgi:hypothetical protein
MRKSQFTRPLSIALELETFEKIKAITDQKGISLAEWIRSAATAALKNMQAEEEQTNGR